MLISSCCQAKVGAQEGIIWCFYNFYPPRSCLWRSVVNFETDSYLMLPELNSLDARVSSHLFMAISRLILLNESRWFPQHSNTTPIQYWVFLIIHHFNCLKYDISMAIIMVIKDNVYINLSPFLSSRLAFVTLDLQPCVVREVAIMQRFRRQSITAY